jgi:hypothetical protein
VVYVGVYVGEGFEFEGFCGRFGGEIEVGVGDGVVVVIRVGIGVVVRRMDRFVRVGASRRRYLGPVGKGGRHSSLMVSYEVVLGRISILGVIPCPSSWALRCEGEGPHRPQVDPTKTVV